MIYKFLEILYVISRTVFQKTKEETPKSAQHFIRTYLQSNIALKRTFRHGLNSHSQSKSNVSKIIIIKYDNYMIINHNVSVTLLQQHVQNVDANL